MSNLLLQNPLTKVSSFGTIVETTVSGILIPGGHIYLKVGLHKGPNSGFGAAHIWAEHAKEMKSLGFGSEAEVPNFVASIVRPGSPVFCEFARLRSGVRVSVVQSSAGMAILEYIGTRGNQNYSVVTAFKNAKAHGTRVGTVR